MWILYLSLETAYRRRVNIHLGEILTYRASTLQERINTNTKSPDCHFRCVLRNHYESLSVTLEFSMPICSGLDQCVKSMYGGVHANLNPDDSRGRLRHCAYQVCVAAWE